MERVNGEISMNPNDHCLISNLDWGTMQFSIVDEASLYERKNTNDLSSAWQNIAQTIAFADKRKSILVIQIQEAPWRRN